jgi:hypothetical protein
MNRFIGHSQVVTTKLSHSRDYCNCDTQNKVFNVCLLSRCLTTNLTWLTLNYRTVFWILLRMNLRIEFRVKVKVKLRPTVSRPVCLGWSTHLNLTTKFLILSDSCVFVDVGRSLWRENGSVVYSCCWASPAQSFSVPSPVGFATIFYCFRFETSLFVASYDSQG